MADAPSHARTQVRAAVVGGGFGGLAAAIRLQAAGVPTTLFEARSQPGGRAYVFRDRGFTFDAGPTVVTAPTSLEEIFLAAGKKMNDYVTLLPVEPLYRLIWCDGFRFDYVGDPVRLLEQIRKRSPNDVEGYRRFVQHAERVFQKGYVELSAEPFLSFWDMAKVAPHLARLRADRSVYATVAKFIQDDRLRQALSFHSLLVGGNPFETSAIYTLIHYLERKWGVFFAKGGTGALVQSLARLFLDVGGRMRLATPVRRIRLDRSRGRVRHLLETDCETEAFDVVVSNADVRHTYADLLRDEPFAGRAAARLERMQWSMSLFVAYFGVKTRYPDVAHHTVLFGPRYRELLDEVFHGDALPEDFSLYLHAPTVTDPGLAPPGCEAFYVLSPVPHLGAADLDWDRIAPKYAQRIYAFLEHRLPGLRRNIVTERYWTPRDFQRELNAHHGSAFSVAPLLTQSAWFRPHNRDPRIPGLYLVGAGTHPGAGIPGVVQSAKATVSVVLKDLER